MWKLGVAFIRGLNVYGKNRITKRTVRRDLRALEDDNLQFLNVINTDTVIFRTQNKDLTSVGNQIERRLKKEIGKKVYVTTRSPSTIKRTSSELHKISTTKFIWDFANPKPTKPKTAKPKSKKTKPRVLKPKTAKS